MGKQSSASPDAPSLPQEWKARRPGHGYYTFEVEDYAAFIHEIAPLFTETHYEFVWRGACNPDWKLQSSLSRRLSSLKKREQEWQIGVSEITVKHVMNFIVQLRGLRVLTTQHEELYRFLQGNQKRGFHTFLTVLKAMTPAQLYLTNELFALGQHHGLATPFLDWTTVPLIALFFAFYEPDEPGKSTEGVGSRVVYALNRTLVEIFCPSNEDHGPDAILFLDSLAYDNPRIIGQAGLFTFVPAHLPVDEWVVTHFNHSEKDPVLLRFLIRNNGRDECLATLNKMNLNGRTIYPDREGAAIHTNYLLERDIKHA